MKYLSILLAALFLVSCGQAAPAETVEPTVVSQASPTNTDVPDTPVPTESPAPTVEPTATPVPDTPTPVPTPEPETIYFPFIFPIPPRYIDANYRFATDMNGLLAPNLGVEVSASSGLPVIAAADGTVVFAGDDLNGSEFDPPGWVWFYGNFVVVEHTLPENYAYGEGIETIYTLYAHLSEFRVETGDTVVQGQKLGEVGATGNASGSLLHFEVRVNGTSYRDVRNPELFFQPYEGFGTLAGTIVDANGYYIYDFDLQVVPVTADSYTQYIQTYPDYRYSDLPPLEELFAIGNLPAGTWQLTFISSGLQTIEFEIRPGELTFLEVDLGAGD